MSSFVNIVPPNMDVHCNAGIPVPYHWDTGVVQYDGTTTVGFYPFNQSDPPATKIEALIYPTSTCSDPWNYYKGYGFDLFIIGFFIALIIKIFLWNK